MRLSKRQLKRIIREEYSRLKRRGLIKESAVWQMNPNMGGPEDQDCPEGTSIEECAQGWVDEAIAIHGEGIIESIGDFVRPGNGADIIEFARDTNSQHDYVRAAAEALSECLEGMSIEDNASGNWPLKAAAAALADAFLSRY